jgi:hypothetical protein
MVSVILHSTAGNQFVCNGQETFIKKVTLLYAVACVWQQWLHFGKLVLRDIIHKAYYCDLLARSFSKWMFVLGDTCRTKIVINDETLEQVCQFTYLGCSISYQFSNDVEFKLAKFLQLIGTIKRTIFGKVGTETILKMCNTLVTPTYLYGSENWTPTALQR